MEHQEGAGECGEAQPNPATPAGDIADAPNGNRGRVGRGDSSAEFGGDGGICGSGGGAGETDAAGISDDFRECAEKSRREFAQESTGMSVAGNLSAGAGGKRAILVREEARSAATWVALALVRFYRFWAAPANSIHRVRTMRRKRSRNTARSAAGGWRSGDWGGADRSPRAASIWCRTNGTRLAARSDSI